MANCIQGQSRYWDLMASSDRLNAIVKQQGQRIIARFIIESPYRPRVGQWLDGRDIRYGKIIKGSPVILGVMVKIIQVIDTFQGTRSVAVSNAWLPWETVGDMFAVCYKPELMIQRDNLVRKSYVIRVIQLNYGLRQGLRVLLQAT